MQTPSNLTQLVNLLLGLINPLLIVLVGLAILAFFKGLIGFLYSAGDVASHKAGKSLMIWGLIGLFVMISFIGIIRLLYSDLGFSRTFGLPTLPDGRRQR
jgi:hypothetical protein